MRANYFRRNLKKIRTISNQGDFRIWRLQTTLGLEEGETLPEDVIIDIMSKYSFLDTTDIERWVRLSSIVKNANGKSDGGDGGSDNFGVRVQVLRPALARS